MTTEEKLVRAQHLQNKINQMREWWLQQMGMHAPEAATRLANLEISLIQLDEEEDILELTEEDVVIDIDLSEMPA